jgi:hypothetical protein
MSAIKVSQKYWNSLTQAEQTFLSENAYDFGLMPCKKVITLVRRFKLPIARVVNAYRYNSQAKLGVLLSDNWIVFNEDNRPQYIVFSSTGFGITQRLSERQTDGHYKELWHN